MAAMDLRTNQEMMAVQNIYPTEYGSHTFKIKENFEETDIKGNNNLFNSLKTEGNSNHDHDPSSLFEVKCPNKNNLEVDNSLFSYSSFKKAMDLRTHNRTLDGGKRTIFDDAEYFAKNYCYKLLPITFEQVDETIIHSEHNYFLVSMTSESEAEEDCSRMMDYSQIKKKNYKRRRTKFREGSEEECETLGDEERNGISSSEISSQNKSFAAITEHENASPDNSNGVQPLDLSAAPLVQDEKTELPLLEHPNSIANNARENDEAVQPDSDKENVNSKSNGILVTITRPDEIENYQPCDLFLNDIARLVPWLIDKDCFEVDILDRTCNRSDEELRKDRLYYVISESTWRLFQKTDERVILTNDQSLGQPLRKTAEKGEKPSYLVFDQFSLAKSLAEYCQEIGGCFEYTFVEEGKNEGCLKKKTENTMDENELKIPVVDEVKMEKTSETNEEKSKDLGEFEEISKKPEQGLNMEAEAEEKQKENEQKTEEITPEDDVMMQKTADGLEKKNVPPKNEKTSVSGPKTTIADKEEISASTLKPILPETVKVSASIPKDVAVKNLEHSISSSKTVSSKEVEIFVPNSRTVALKNKTACVPNTEKKFMPSKNPKKSNPTSKSEKTNRKQTQQEKTSVEPKKDSKGSTAKQSLKRFSSESKSSIQPKPKTPRITTRSKSTSELETSQKSDPPVSEKRKREGSVLTKAEPPKKLTKPTDTEDTIKTRSGKVLEKVKIEKPTIKKKENKGPKITRKRTQGRPEEEATTGRCLRSQKVTPKSKPKGKR